MKKKFKTNPNHFATQKYFSEKKIVHMKILESTKVAFDIFVFWSGVSFGTKMLCLWSTLLFTNNMKTLEVVNACCICLYINVYELYCQLKNNPCATNVSIRIMW